MYFGPRFFEIAIHTSTMITEAVFIAIPNERKVRPMV
jgi:hypothetical protein